MSIDLHFFKDRRNCFLEHLGGKAGIIPASPMVTHHADCEYPFRQNSDFWYLTGFDEPDAIALFLPYMPEGERYILFVLPKEPDTEVWNGFRWGTQGAIDTFGADLAFPIDEFSSRIGNYLKNAEGLVFRIGKYPKTEQIILNIWGDILDRFQRNGSAPLSLEAPCPFLHKMRLKKDSKEIKRMREAARISAEAHELVREIARPGMNEKYIQGIIEQYFLQENTRGPGYNSIVAGGDNACVLHYTANNSILVDGDLLLVDAGCSLVDYYNGDITRTFPINGKFSPEQRDLYEIVLAAQLAAIDIVLPGNNTNKVHFKALEIIVEGLVELGLLVGNVDSLIEQGAYRHIYMHRTGHWLGLDVHDVGAYRLGEFEVPLEEGMILTVEPGIYISDRLPVPKGQPEIPNRWKGIGIRIEDDILVNDTSCEVLTSKALKSLDDMQGN